MKKSLKLKNATVAVFNILKEGNTVFNGVDECIDDAIEAVKSNKGKRIVALEVDETLTNYKIYDNGIGQTAYELEKAYSDFYFHGWKEHNYVGTRGFGRFAFLSIVGNLKNQMCVAKIISAVDDKTATIVTINLVDNDEILSSPVIETVDNDFDNNKYNIFNRKLKGTIVEVYNGEKLSFDEKQIVYLGARHNTAISDERVGIYINGKRIPGIDITHDYNVKEKSDKIVCQGLFSDDCDKYATLYKDLTIYSRSDKTKIFNLGVKCTVSLNIELTKKFCPWEKYFKYNQLGGVFVNYNGRLVEIGGNTQDYFKQVAPEKGNTKTTGEYGDTSGGTTGFLRITIFPNGKEMADIFGIQSVKSKGITPFSDNESLINDYYVKDEIGRELSFYQYICHIRKLFSDIIYRKYILPETKRQKKTNKTVNYKSASKKINEYYNDYDFIAGELKTMKQRGRGGTKHKTDEITIRNKNIAVTFSLVKNKESDAPTYVLKDDKIEINEKSLFYEEIYCKLFKTQKDIIYNKFVEVVYSLVEAEFHEGNINAFLVKYTKNISSNV